MKKIMPLWFMDVVGTEQKIAELAEKGSILTSFSPLSGTAEFTEQDGETAVYRICYQKNCGGNPPKGLAASGWESVCGSKNIYIVKNTDANTQNVPTYKFWKRLSTLIIFGLVFILSFFGGTFLGMIATCASKGRNVLSVPQFPWITAVTVDLVNIP